MSLSGPFWADAGPAFRQQPTAGAPLSHQETVKGALTVHGPRGRLDLDALVSYPDLALTRCLLALEARFVDELTPYEDRRMFMRLHEWLRDEYRDHLTVGEFVSVLVFAGHCRTHVTERIGNDVAGWTCTACEFGFPGILS